MSKCPTCGNECENYFNPDWDLLEATQESLREHMQIIKQFRSEHDKTINKAVEKVWISVEDRLPEPYRSVELFRPEEGAGEDQIWRGYMNKNTTCFYSSEHEKPLDGITHWMPLPSPPKTGD